MPRNTLSRRRAEPETLKINVQMEPKRTVIFSNADFRFAINTTSYDAANHKYIADIIICSYNKSLKLRENVSEDKLLEKMKADTFDILSKPFIKKESQETTDYCHINME